MKSVSLTIPPQLARGYLLETAVVGTIGHSHSTKPQPFREFSSTLLWKFMALNSKLIRLFRVFV